MEIRRHTNVAPCWEVEVEGSGKELLIHPLDTHWHTSEVRV